MQAISTAIIKQQTNILIKKYSMNFVGIADFDGHIIALRTQGHQFGFLKPNP